MGVRSLDSGARLPGCECLLCHRLCDLGQGREPDRTLSTSFLKQLLVIELAA